MTSDQALTLISLVTNIQSSLDSLSLCVTGCFVMLCVLSVLSAAVVGGLVFLSFVSGR